MTRRIELYGRLREAGLGDAVELDVAPGARAEEVLRELARRLGARGELLRGAVLASAEAVLSASSAVPEAGALAVLPPVCGG